MTESIVLNQNQIPTDPETDVCKQIVTDGIYTICADNGEVIDYDEERFFVSNTEGIDRLDKLSKSDKVYSHYQRHYNLLPNSGIGTIPAKFYRNLRSYTFAYRLSTAITNSIQKAIFIRVAQKIFHRKIKNKLYILGAFAIRYCSVDFNYVMQLILNFSQEDENTARQRLSDAIANLNHFLNKKLGLSKAEMQTLSKAEKQMLKQFTYDLLSKYGYINFIDKFSKLYNFGVVKLAVILLLLRDNRKNEAIKLYEYRPEYNIGFKHFVVVYEILGKRYVKRLTHGRLHTLLFSPSLRLYNFKIIL